MTRTYDADDRLTRVKDWLGNTTTFAYDNDSNLVTQSEANGVVTTNTYGGATRLAVQYCVGNDERLNIELHRGTPWAT